MLISWHVSLIDYKLKYEKFLFYLFQQMTRDRVCLTLWGKKHWLWALESQTKYDMKMYFQLVL